MLTLADHGYPRMLRNIPDPPPALYLDGTIPEMVSVALVGSRKSPRHGRRDGPALWAALAERGVCVVSGLALGVDAAAQEGPSVQGGDGRCARVRHRRYVSNKVQTVSRRASALGPLEGQTPRLDLTRLAMDQFRYRSARRP